MSALEVISVAFVGLCVAIIYCDLKFMRIPDVFPIAFVALFAVSVFVLWPEVSILWHVLASAMAFCICFVLFALQIIGGGDTKVIPAMVLFVPLGAFPEVALLFSFCLIVSIGIIALARKWRVRTDHGWAVVRSTKLPMGLAIGSTGLAAIAFQVS